LEQEYVSKEVSVLHGLTLRVFAHTKSVTFLVIIQQMQHKFWSILPCVYVFG